MPKTADAPHICFDRVIPEVLDPHAAAHNAAVSEYLTTLREKARKSGKTVKPEASFTRHVTAAGKLGELHANDPVTVARMAVINIKKWEAGHKLTCRFLDGDSLQQDKVIEKAKIWESYANVQLEFGDDPNAEVRISFVADSGSWSAIGQDCLVTSYFPKDKPTMNFGWLRDDTDDREYERVVVHEFGHALGCIHEHQSPRENLQWNKATVYKTFSGPPNNWSRAEIDHNILQKYSPEGISATSFDRKSIMLYQFDAALFTNHKGTPLNFELSKLDEKMIGTMYPPAPAVVRKKTA
jgi:hypothetical protein